MNLAHSPVRVDYLLAAATSTDDPKREPSGAAACGANEDIRGLVENYGVSVAEIARQVGISTSGVSKILSRTLST
jgi:antitoxin component HigA of HigAB toxin-antitoxin module